MTKVKSDTHGLYVRAGGKVFRPVKTENSYPLGQPTCDNGVSQFKDGDDVKAKHMAQTPFGQLTQGATVEIWHSHGDYIGEGGKTIPSDQCWFGVPATGTSC